MTTDGINAGGKEVKGIADGTAADSAVSKGQMETAISNATTNANHNFAGDDATVISRKHGEQLNIKGGASTTATDLTSGNIAVVGDTTTGTLNIKMAKALTGLTSATFTDGSGNTQTVTGDSSTISDAAGNSTVVSKVGVTTTDAAGNITTTAPTGVTVTPAGTGTTPISVTTSGISAGNKEIKNVANGTTDDAAVNKKQMDDAVKSATDATTALGNNTIALGGDTGSTTAKKLSTNAITFNIKGDTGANALITTSATGDNVTIAPTAKLTAAVTAAEKSADKDLSNISSAGKTVIKDLAVTSAQDAVNVTGTGLATVSSNTAGGVKTYTVDVKAGNLVVDANGQVGANGATGTGGAAGTDGVATTQNVATAINDAITKSNANTAQALADAEHKFDGDTGATSVRKHGEVLSIKGGVTTPADLATGNIGVVSDGAGTLNIRLAKVLSGLISATFKDASGNTTMVTGGSTTIADTSGNTQTLAPTKSEIKDSHGVSTITTKDGVTAKDASGNTTSLTKGGLSTTDGTNTTTIAPTGMTATDGTNTVKVEGSGIDAGGTEIKHIVAGTAADSAVNKGQMDDAITKATTNATHEFGGDDATVVSRKHGEKLTIKGGATTTDADLTSGNIAVIGDATNGALNIKLAKALTGLTSATFKDASGNTTMVTGGSTTIADTSGNTQTLAPTKSEIKDNNGVSTVTTKDGVTAKDASGNTTSLTKGGVNATDGNGKTTSLTNTGVSATDGNGHTTSLTNDGLSTTDGKNTTTVVPTGITATDGSHTVKVEGSGIDAGNTEIKHIAAGTSADSAVNKGQMDDAITKATADATHEFAGDTGSNSVRKHGEVLSIKGGVTDTNKLSNGNIGVISDGAGTLNVKLSKELTGLTSATYTDGSGNTQTVTGGSSTISDAAGHSTVVSKGGVTTTDGTNTTTVAPSGITATDGTHTVTLGGSGINAGGTEIKNVGKATSDDAAVNKKQMDDAVKAASDATKALGNNTITFGGDSGSTTAKKLNTTGGITFNIKGDTGANALITTSASGDDVTIAPTAKLTAAVTAAEKSADKDLSNLSTTGKNNIKDLAKSAASWNVQTNGTGTTAVVGGDTVNFINGDNIAITNTGHAITIGTAKDVSFDKVTVGGMTLDKNGILSGISSITGSGTGAPTMTFNSQNGNTPANVSINSNLDMGGHRITGVGPAEKPTDAVNKQQVDQALRGLAGLADNAARQYASKAGANAAALAALKPIQYDPLEPTQIMAGVGNYKSQTAVALGMAHYTNENTMFNIGVSIDSHDNMVNAGVTHKFGYSPEKKAIPDRYKGGPISSIYVMQDEMQSLLAKDQEKDAVISKQASEIDTLRQQNEDMQRKIDMILAKLQ